MKKIAFITVILIFCSFSTGIILAEPGSQRGPAVMGNYNPAVTYPGVHAAAEILFKNRATSTTWQSVPVLRRLQKVTCSDAVAHLQREGKWHGHLNSDGSCGSIAEPVEWILGNRLNYDEAQKEGFR